MDEHQYKDFWEFIKLLYDNSLLEHVIVIGSWAEYLYAQSAILPGFTANLRTLDIDFLVKNMRKPSPQVNIATLAKEAGYTIDHDVLDGTTKIYTPGFMEIEFLIAQQGSGEKSILSTNLGVKAQALRHMTILKEYTVKIHLFNMEISVPQPEAYILHKIVINNERGKKAEKDNAAIATMLPFLKKEQVGIIYQHLAKKEQKTVITFFQEHAKLDWRHIYTSREEETY
jgi:hypothetical protein